MPDLVLAADPRQTRVRAQWPDGTITDAVIYNRIGDRVHGAYQHQADSDRWDVFDRLMGELSVVLPPFPALIPAQPEMEDVTIEIPCANVYGGKDAAIFCCDPDVADDHWDNLLLKSGPVKITYRVPKPSPPEPVVLEGQIVDGFWSTHTSLKVRLDSNWDAKNNGTFLGRRCTLTIHPEEK